MNYLTPFCAELVELTKEAGVADGTKTVLKTLNKHKGKIGLVGGGAVAHDQGTKAYSDWKLGRQYRQAMERRSGQE